VATVKGISSTVTFNTSAVSFNATSFNPTYVNYQICDKILDGKIAGAKPTLEFLKSGISGNCNNYSSVGECGTCSYKGSCGGFFYYSLLQVISRMTESEMLDYLERDIKDIDDYRVMAGE